MTDDELSCKELVEVVTEYLEGALPADDVRRFEAHLAGCEGCDAYLEQMRETIRLTGMLRDDELADEARDALLDAFRGWKHSASAT